MINDKLNIINNRVVNVIPYRKYINTKNKMLKNSTRVY